MTDLSASELPRAGVRSVEFCPVAAGPFCGMLLADMGAEVWKIESPAGDTLREWPPHRDGYSENFASLNRNKYSATLDLKTPADLELARRLIAQADVVIENNRPGVMARLGLGYEALRALQPRLVFCSISAFGQTGPRAGEGGFDLTIQAAAGVMSVTGEAGGAPVKCGVPVADFASGLYAAFAIASALRQVERSGEGLQIDVPMFGCTLGIAALQTSEFFGNGRSPVKLGSAHPRNAPYQAYAAADGYFAIAAGNQKLWEAVCRVMQAPELAVDPRFASTALRARHQVELKDILEVSFGQRPVAHWVAAFRDAGVPSTPINDYAAALDDPQVAHMGWVRELELPGAGATRTFASPLRLDGRNLPIRQRPPALGEHTGVLRDLYPANADA